MTENLSEVVLNRRQLIDKILDEELPKYSEALEKLGEYGCG